MEIYNIKESIKAQEKYCNDNHVPLFAPSDGICFCCCINIYQKVKHMETGVETGIPVESAGDHLITGCPHCNRTFCD